MQHDHIDFRLKNVNEGEVKKVWRYQAWDSYSPNEQKWRTLVMKKVLDREGTFCIAPSSYGNGVELGTVSTDCRCN